MKDEEIKKIECIISNECPYDKTECSDRCACVANYAHAKGMLDGAFKILKVDGEIKS